MKHLAYLLADPIISKIKGTNHHKESFYGFLVEYVEGNWEITFTQHCGTVAFTNSISLSSHQAHYMQRGVLDEIVQDFVMQTLHKFHAARLPDTRGK